MSVFSKFATVQDYPRGLMNLCPCGQGVLAPAKYHEGFTWWENPNKCKELFEKKELDKKDRYDEMINDSWENK
jgi:hypothetical protein